VNLACKRFVIASACAPRTQTPSARAWTKSGRDRESSAENISYLAQRLRR
jgi:hypothetical protein